MKAQKSHYELLNGHSAALQAAFRADAEIKTNPYQLIKSRAYEIWQRRGCGEGMALNDWLQAETEICRALRSISRNDVGFIEERMQQAADNR